MFIDANRAASPTDTSLQNKLVLGIVIDNNDPAKLQRVKLRAHGLHRNVQDIDVPWAIPYFNINPQAIGSGLGSINIPAIGTKVLFFLQNDEISNPVYIGGFLTKDLIIEELNEDYPHSYGFIDRSGNLHFTNTEKDHFIIHHVSGTKIKIDGSGHMQIDVADNKVGPNAVSDLPKGIGIDVIGNVDIAVNGNVELKATGDVYMTGRTIHMNTKPGRPVRQPRPRERPVPKPLIEATDY